MNENEFLLNGKTFIAVERDIPCDGCVLWDKDCGRLQRLGKIPPCFALDRKDENDVIFIEKGKAKQ